MTTSLRTSLLKREGVLTIARNYAKETKYEDSRAQVLRREARNQARRRARRLGRVGPPGSDSRELDHIGYHRTGSLRNVPVRLVSKHANRIRQPSR